MVFYSLIVFICDTADNIDIVFVDNCTPSTVHAIPVVICLVVALRLCCNSNIIGTELRARTTPSTTDHRRPPTLSLRIPRIRIMTDAIKDLWRDADAVCFDVDSTVIKEEAIDEVAKFCNKGSEVQKLTSSAMSGKMDFREALSARLQIIKPSLQQIRNFIKDRPFNLTPGIKELVELLQQKNIPVYLISGGFRGLIGPIAIELSIPLQRIHANKLKFFLNGDYAGFDEKEPTSKNGGKAEVIRMLKEKYGYTKLFMIGDGITDLEASPPADAFIGFGGNVVREEVKSKSKWYIESFQELIDTL